MASRLTSRFYTCGAALATLGVTLLTTARPASAQEIERLLAGVRLGSRGTTVLAKYGNPNDVVIGDVGIRQPPSTGGQGGQSGQGGQMGQGGEPSMGYGGGMGGASAGGKRGMMGMSSAMGGGRDSAPSMMPSGPGGSGFPGSPGGGFGSGSYGSGSSGSGSGFGGAFGGGADPRTQGGEGGGAGGGIGAFGQTVSPLANEQEVTWVYNRKVGNNVVSYEFLIGPNGDVSQIRVSGYTGGNSKTKRGIVLGSTYKDVVRTYGYPESHQTGPGGILIASYKQKAHVSFQFLNQSGQTNLYSPGNKVIAITIASVE